MVLAKRPQAGDTVLFVEALEAAPMEVLSACAGALAKLPPSDKPDDVIALLKTLRRLSGDRREYALREQVVRLLQRAVRRGAPDASRDVYRMRVSVSMKQGNPNTPQ